MPEDSPFKLKISLSVLELLGKQLYSNVPKCISEAVANSWDADATNVDINLDADSNTIEIIDNGIGMDKEDVNDKYLNVGYRRRRENGDKSEEKKRPVMGRKGVGKLALFGIADTIEVYTKQEDSGPQAFEIDAAEIREEIKEKNPDSAGNGTIHEPPKLPQEKFNEHWPEDQERGTVLRLTEVDKEIQSVQEKALIKRIARRFSVLVEEDFKVNVNDYEVEITDRDYFHKIEYLWKIGDPEIDYEQLCNENKLKGVTELDGNVGSSHEVSGWIGSSDKPSDLSVHIGGSSDRTDDINKIHLIVRGKMAKEDLLSEVSSSKHFTEYLFGDVHADYLDDTSKKDIHTTNREDFNREDLRYFALKNFLKEKLDTISEEWDEYREEEGTEQARAIEPINNWYNGLEKQHHKEKAKQLFGKIHRMSPSDAEREEFYKYGVLAFERLRIKDNLQKLSELNSDNIEALNAAFVDMEDLEAAQYHQIVRQRLEVIEKLEEHVDQHDLEETIQEHLFNNLWLLDPSWERATGTEFQEKRVYKLFEKKKSDIDDTLSDDQIKGRVDLKYRKSAGEHIIVELKKADRVVTQGALTDQANKYRRTLRDILEDMGRGGESIEVVCVIGKDLKQWSGPSDRNETERSLSQQNIRLVKYNELIDNAQKSYQEFLDQQNKFNDIEEVMNSIEGSFQAEQL